MRIDFSIKIGDYIITPQTITPGKVWIENKDGEGAEVEQALLGQALEDSLDKFFKEVL